MDAAAVVSDRVVGHSGLGDGGTHEEDVVDLGRGDLLASAIDQLLDPAGERETAVVVAHAPLLRGDGVEPALHLGLGEAVQGDRVVEHEHGYDGARARVHAWSWASG
jgi:hypothetical protein